MSYWPLARRTCRTRAERRGVSQITPLLLISITDREHDTHDRRTTTLTDKTDHHQNFLPGVLRAAAQRKHDQVDDAPDAPRGGRGRPRRRRGNRKRPWYRTSPPTGERWIRYGERYDHPPHGNPSWFKPRGGVLAPINAEDVRHPPEGVDEYRHGLWQRVNAASVAAFSAVGHGVIDDVEMLGRRQDAHPGSHNGEGDTVHYCLPGPIDYALDEVIRVLRRSFDQAPRFYGV